jgi:hypothetical protein
MNRWKNYYEQMKEATVILLLNWEPVIPHYNNIKLKDVSDHSEFWLHAVSDHEATITIPFFHFPVRTIVVCLSTLHTQSLFVLLLFANSVVVLYLHYQQILLPENHFINIRVIKVILFSLHLYQNPCLLVLSHIHIGYRS